MMQISDILVVNNKIPLVEPPIEISVVDLPKDTSNSTITITLNEEKTLCDSTHDMRFRLNCGHQICKECLFKKFKCTVCDYTANDFKIYAEKGAYVENFLIGQMYHKGLFYSACADFSLAEKYYLDAAKNLDTKNDPELAIHVHATIGSFYYDTLDDDNKAYKWYILMYKKIEDADEKYKTYKEQLHNLARLHMRDEGKENKIDAQKALDILKKISLLCPDKDIYYDIGEIYFYEKYGMWDTFEAYIWYQLADCKYSMGILQYDIGNYQRSIELIQQLSPGTNNYAWGMIKLGDIYSKKFDDEKKDYIKAIDCYKKSVTDDCCVGYLHVGDLYLMGGYGILKDYIEAAKNYQLFIKENKDAEKTHIGHDRLSRLYKLMSNNEKAAEHQKLHDALIAKK